MIPVNSNESYYIAKEATYDEVGDGKRRGGVEGGGGGGRSSEERESVCWPACLAFLWHLLSRGGCLLLPLMWFSCPVSGSGIRNRLIGLSRFLLAGGGAWTGGIVSIIYWRLAS